MSIQTPSTFSTPNASPAKAETDPLVWRIVAFVSVFQTLYCISDRAIAWLLKFLAVLLHYCGNLSPRLLRVSQALPSSIYLRDKFVQGDNGKNSLVSKYVVCVACHTLYKYSDCIERPSSRSRQVRKTCTTRVNSRVCGEYLLKDVVLRSGCAKFYPYKYYCYCSLISTLQRLILKPGFVDMCEETRNNHSYQSLFDVYQGRIWKDFLVVDGVDFLSAAFSYGFMLNIDWFQPFEHYTYSLGVIYLVVMNLPRTKRYKRENVIIVGTIPGPSEPPLTINSYLFPLVTELQQLWSGVTLNLPDGTVHLVRGALLTVACDMPASRKVCGFLSHSANLGCPRCYCEFSEGGLNRNYSNVKRLSWSMRSNKRHREDVKKLCSTPVQTTKARSHMESQLGCRYSVLLELSYFDPVRMNIVDPMHNLFLGSAKYFTQKILLGTGTLTKDNVCTINGRIKRIKVPLDMGRLPSCIDSGSTFTAEQWMNWTLYFSIYCLHGLLTVQQLECWRAFVLACRRLCKHTISNDDITVADLLLLQFVKRVKNLFGSQFITPNMHMHLHLCDCLKDYGPLHAFWLYSFERYNGLLGKQPTNNRSIDIQLIKCFLRDNIHLEMLATADRMPLADCFLPCVCRHPGTSNSETVSEFLRLPPKSTLFFLDVDDQTQIKSTYLHLYPELAMITGDIQIPSTCKKYTNVLFKGKKLTSTSINGNVPYALARPLPVSSDSIEPEPRPVRILYYVQHNLIVPLQQEMSTTSYSETFAVCEWLQEHPKCHVMGKPVTLWCKNLLQPGMNRFVPIQHIMSQVIVAVECVDDENVLVVIPILE